MLQIVVDGVAKQLILGAGRVEAEEEYRIMSSALDSLKLGVEIDDGAPILDLAKDTITTWLIRQVGLKIRDIQIEGQVNREFQQ